MWIRGKKNPLSLTAVILCIATVIIEKEIQTSPPEVGKAHTSERSVPQRWEEPRNNTSLIICLLTSIVNIDCYEKTLNEFHVGSIFEWISLKLQDVFKQSIVVFVCMCMCVRACVCACRLLLVCCMIIVCYYGKAMAMVLSFFFSPCYLKIARYLICDFEKTIILWSGQNNTIILWSWEINC